MYRKAAGQKYADAQYNLGDVFFEGQGVKWDFGEAARWYRKAADQGHGGAQYNPGVAFFQCQGLKRGFCGALRWWHKAAEQGHEGAKKGAPLVEEKPWKQRDAAAVASEPSASRSCTNCGVAETEGSVALKPCSQCKAVVYFGKECLAQHWRGGEHRAMCK